MKDARDYVDDYARAVGYPQQWPDLLEQVIRAAQVDALREAELACLRRSRLLLEKDHAEPWTVAEDCAAVIDELVYIIDREPQAATKLVTTENENGDSEEPPSGKLPR